MKAEENVIEVHGVFKDFQLPHEKTSSVKGLFTNLLQSNALRHKETQHALKDINFHVKKGEFFGIVGRNGSGKSTLLKILAGIYQPNKGSIKVSGKLVPFIELGVGFNPELTGRENVNLNGALLGFSRQEVDAMYQDIVDFAEIEKFMDQKLKNYSSGMQVRLAFSIATRAKADILLIDEVLAVGDADFQRKCFDYFQKLKGNGTTVVFVTHDMNAVREYCDRAILIEKNEIVAAGHSDEVATKYTRMFIDGANKNQDKQADSKRWGDRAIQYTRIDAPKTLKNDKELVFSVTAVANKDIEKPNFGFLIRNASRTHILGTNTVIKKKRLDFMKAGQEVTIEWRIANVFNDGVHYIDPAAVYKGDKQVADWWEDAASFAVLKEERTPYLVNPDIACTIDEAN